MFGRLKAYSQKEWVFLFFNDFRTRNTPARRNFSVGRVTVTIGMFATYTSRFTIKNLRYALCAMLYALCWYVKCEGNQGLKVKEFSSGFYDH